MSMFMSIHVIPTSHACNTVLNKGLEVKVFVELSTIHNSE